MTEQSPRTPLMAGNWKMNLNHLEAIAHIQKVAFGLTPVGSSSTVYAGADSGVTSIHKLLTGLTQSAILNIGGTLIDPVNTARWLSLLQTTSPSSLRAIRLFRRRRSCRVTSLIGFACLLL